MFITDSAKVVMKHQICHVVRHVPMIVVVAVVDSWPAVTTPVNEDVT